MATVVGVAIINRGPRCDELVRCLRSRIAEVGGKFLPPAGTEFEIRLPHVSNSRQGRELVRATLWKCGDDWGTYFDV
jgi:hypothetical protein